MSDKGLVQRDPKTGQLKKGSVLNPRGRPKGTGLTDMLRHILENEIVGSGDARTKAEKLLDATIAAAISGDATSKKLIFAYLEGLPKQNVHVVHHVPKNVIDAIRLARGAPRLEVIEASAIDVTERETTAQDALGGAQNAEGDAPVAEIVAPSAEVAAPSAEK